MPRVTALQETRAGVAVELDGERWRTIPVDVVVRSDLRVGRELDRPALRLLGRELRRTRAVDLAARALARRDLTRGEVSHRLERARVGPADREQALSTLERAGVVDDTRAAAGRAEALARRGYGDEAIRADLERRGVSSDDVTTALEALPPESERALTAAGRAGRTPAAARRLAARGFSAEVVEAFMEADVAEHEP